MTHPQFSKEGRTREVSVNLPDCPYPVYIGQNILKNRMESFRNSTGGKIFLITNETLLSLYPGLIEELRKLLGGCPVHAIPDGEKFKNLETLAEIYDFLIAHNAIRSNTLVALGGGVVGDVAGYAAATYMRGMNLIQIPTTLLSQVDSSIGGKTGVNHPKAKNIIGSFKQPLFSLIDLDFLKTLSSRELIAGYAEIFKHSLIRDPELFETLVSMEPLNLVNDTDLLEEVVFRSCAIKASVVEADEKEANLRAILNFGHTLGHLFETATKYQKYLHGEAVIAGMDFAAWKSFVRIENNPAAYRRIHEHLLKTKVRLQIPEMKPEEFINTLMKDKKNLQTGIRFVRLKEIGKAEILENQSLEGLWSEFADYLKTENSLVSLETRD